jgi:hypothetical protein
LAFTEQGSSSMKYNNNFPTCHTGLGYRAAMHNRPVFFMASRECWLFSFLQEGGKQYEVPT